MKSAAKDICHAATCMLFLVCGPACADSINVECANTFNNVKARFVIDFDHQKVDGNPASITDSFITWKTSGQVGGRCTSKCGYEKFWKLDRAQGTIHAYFRAASGLRFPDDNYAGCEKVAAPANKF
ncbi:MAG TPA: hypothetical protein VEZ90_10170 [Blastocatellia bacterium]|nr:hypothetical protein [Blastocatellia bacterium]